MEQKHLTWLAFKITTAQQITDVSFTDFVQLFCDRCQSSGLKHTDDNVDIITEAPESGIYRMSDDGRVSFDRFDYHRRAVESENEAFFLRISNAGDYRYEGADLGILVTRGRSMTKNFELTDQSKRWIHGIKSKFTARDLDAANAGPLQAEPAFKIM